MNLRRINLEHMLYLTAFLLAAFLRLLNLGKAPLSDAEASWALQSLALAENNIEGFTIGPNPAYVVLTGALFALFGSLNAIARFWPALAGSLLVLAPAVLVSARRSPDEESVKRQASFLRLAGIILAFGLAIDPGLVTTSRLAGSPMMALAFGILALAGWLSRRPVLTGIFAGLAFLSGPGLLFGLVSLALALLVGRWMRKAELGDPLRPWLPDDESAYLSKAQSLQAGLFALGAVIVIAGSFFFRFPQGLAAPFAALPAYFQGWVLPSDIPALRLLVALLVYSPLAVIFAVFGAGRGLAGRFRQDDSQARIHLRSLPLVWAVVALALALVYPGRQVTDLVWVLVPLWIVAALELAHLLSRSRLDINQSVVISAGHALLIVVLLALLWYTFATLSVSATNLAGVRLAVLGGILLLAGLISALVALGWSWPVARLGIVWGATAGLSLYLISALMGASQVRFNSPQELWTPLPGPGQGELMQDTLATLAEWSTGDPRNLQVVVTRDAPSLRWALRSFSDVRFLSEPVAGQLPDVVLTGQGQEDPALSASYRGQDFVWWTRPGWLGALPANPAAWLTYRTAPLEQEKVILWARGDLFPASGSENQPEVESSTPPEEP